MSGNFHCNSTSLCLSLSYLSFDMQAQSRKFNADIEVYTLHYAMVEQLRNPPKGINYNIMFILLKTGHYLPTFGLWLA